MREARNDEVPDYASRMHSASPRLAISTLRSVTNSPVCTRFARLDWGYEKLCLSEARCHAIPHAWCHAIPHARCHAIPHAPYIPNTVVGETPTLLRERPGSSIELPGRSVY